MINKRRKNKSNNTLLLRAVRNSYSINMCSLDSLELLIENCFSYVRSLQTTESHSLNGLEDLREGLMHYAEYRAWIQNPIYQMPVRHINSTNLMTTTRDLFIDSFRRVRQMSRAFILGEAGEDRIATQTLNDNFESFIASNPDNDLLRSTPTGSSSGHESQ